MSSGFSGASRAIRSVRPTSSSIERSSCWLVTAVAERWPSCTVSAIDSRSTSPDVEISLTANRVLPSRELRTVTSASAPLVARTSAISRSTRR
jgi:hypothetical protein